jgi:hypothetical protein
MPIDIGLMITFSNTGSMLAPNDPAFKRPLSQLWSFLFPSWALNVGYYPSGYITSHRNYRCSLLSAAVLPPVLLPRLHLLLLLLCCAAI